jgi:hypothetical protein
MKELAKNRQFFGGFFHSFENHGYTSKFDCLFLEDWWVSGYVLGLYPVGTCVSF